ncbi:MULTISPECIES: hypothetical protein [Leeia]|uniref:Uncharacterized protein n=1 Tax=Leeia aquatica TaxID=2725557 RepID=A0A847RST6_9NEIS|nr:hypothetical protein [Leeia aquatica]NLR74270.1 hypothetical protein [Leeia aquatica]
MHTPFRDVDHALKFAFAIREYRIEPRNMLSRLVVTEHGAELLPAGPATLTAWDWHAQSALILARVGQLERPLLAYCLAFYSWGAERVVAFAELEQLMMERCGITDRIVVEGLVRRHVNRFRGLKAPTPYSIHKRSGTSRRAIDYLAELIRTELEHLETTLETQLHDYWKETGLVG